MSDGQIDLGAERLVFIDETGADANVTRALAAARKASDGAWASAWPYQNHHAGDLKVAQGFGIRPKVIFWMGWPVTEFMMVATMLMAAR